MPYSVAPITIGAMSSGAYLLAQLSAETKIPLGEALGGFVFVAGLVWWLGRRLQKIEDDVRELKNELASRSCQKTGNCDLNE